MSTRSSRRRRVVAAALAAACFSSMSNLYAVNQVNMIGQRLVRMNYASDGVSYGGTYDYQVFNVMPGAPPVGFLNVVSDLNLNGSITPNEWIVQNVPMPLTPSLTSYPMLGVWWDPGTFNLAPGQPYPTRASIEPNRIMTTVPTPDPSWANTNAPTGLSIWGDTDHLGQQNAPVLTTPNSTTVALEAKKISGVPDIAQQGLECGPTSAANSLRSLESQYPFEMGGKLPASNDDLIKELMKAMTGSDARPFPGLFDNQLYDGKKKYAKDKGLPIVVKGGNGSAAASGAKAFDFIKQEIDAGEDVELLVFWPGGGGHWVTVTGYGVDGAKKTLEVNDPDDKKTGAVDWTVDAAGNVTAPKGCTVGWAVSESVTPLWDWVPPSPGGGGAWASVGNWSGPAAGFPDSFADIANFGDGSPGAVGPVFLDGSRTVNTVYIGHSNPGSYVITPVGTSALTLEDGYGSGSILHGSPTTDFIQAPVVAADQVYVGVYDPDGKLHFGNTISAARMNIHGPGTTYLDGPNGSPGSPAFDVDIDGGRTVLTAPQYLRRVTVPRLGGMTVATPVVEIELLALNLVSVQPIHVDIGDNKLILHGNAVGSWNGSAYTETSGYVASGRNGGGWTGNGIVTSQTDATTGNFTSIGAATAQQVKGLASATDTAIWAGHIVTGSDTLVMYTYGGDANEDGKLNVDDYGRIDFNVPLAVAGWFNGDFNWDGKINVDDYGIIDFNIGIQGPPFPTGADPSGSGAVPEPGMLFAWLTPLALIVRRRKAGRLRDF